MNNGILYNYTDDNTLSYCNPNYDDSLSTLEYKSL